MLEPEEKVIIECPVCGAFVETACLAGFAFNPTESSVGGRYLFLRCLKCNDPILAVQDNIGNTMQGDIWDTPRRVYPMASPCVNPNLPKALREAFSEAASCFRGQSYTATVIMCRKTLEGLCKFHGVRERNLVKSLAKMRDEHIIDDRLYEWADALRLSGNEAAHDVDATFSRRDASDIIDFTAAILDYLFSFREKFKEFKKRRERDQ